LIMGAFAGWLAGKITRGSGFGLLGNLLLGVAGAFVGGFLFSFLGLKSFTFIGSLISATAGAAALILVAGAIRKA